MCDARNQPAEGGKLLGLDQRLLGLAQISQRSLRGVSGVANFLLGTLAFGDLFGGDVDRNDLAARGDIFGLEHDFHRFTAEAIVDTTVRLMKRESLERVAKTDFAIVRSLLNMTTDSLQHAENHMLLLGRKTSLERVAAFLLEMDRRLPAAGVMALPMCRRDIADYLGLTLETVSRALSELHKKGYLRFLGQTQREIVVLNSAGLAELDG